MVKESKTQDVEEGAWVDVDLQIPKKEGGKGREGQL